MSTFIKPPLKYVCLTDSEIVRKVYFDSKEQEEKAVKSYFNLISALLRPNEEKLLEWTGYYNYSELGFDYHMYVKCAFVLTEERLYLAGETFGQTTILISEMSTCREFCLFKEEVLLMPEFVLSFNNVVSFMYDIDSNIGWALTKELRNRNINEP